MTQSAESIAQKIYGQFHSGKTVPEEIQLITDAIQTERAKAEARIKELKEQMKKREKIYDASLSRGLECAAKDVERIEALEARERELQAENKQHLEKLAEAVALGSTQADRFDIEIDKRDQRITALEKALRGFCDFHEKNASWDKTGEVYYKAMSLLPIRFPSPSLSTKEAS